MESQAGDPEVQELALSWAREDCEEDNCECPAFPPRQASCRLSCAFPFPACYKQGWSVLWQRASQHCRVALATALLAPHTQPSATEHPRRARSQPLGAMDTRLISSRAAGAQAACTPLQGIRPQPAACVPLYAQAHTGAQNLDHAELRWNVTAPHSTGMEPADSGHNIQIEQLAASGLQPPAAINPCHLGSWLPSNGEADFRQLWQRRSALECASGGQRGRQPGSADCKEGVTMGRGNELHEKQSSSSGISRQSGIEDSEDAEQEKQLPNLASRSGAVRRQMPQSLSGEQSHPADLVFLSERSL